MHNGYASSAGNSDTVDGIHANELLTALSNSNKGISITVGGTTKSVSNISVNYASSAGNADAVDGEHLIKNGSGTGIKQVYYFSAQDNNTSYIKLGTLNTVSVTGWGTSKVMFTVKGGINFGGTNESVYEVAASTRGSIQVTSTLVRGNRELKFGYVSTSSNVEIWMAYDGTYRGVTEVEVSSSVNFTLTMTETTTKPSGFVEGSYRILAATADNVASATKLQTPRTIWGQSFDGTGNVNGTIYINNSDSGNGAIILNNNVNTHARISAIKDQVVFNTGAAIRFGATNWEYSDWAGLKYDTVANAIYLGIADGTVFNYYSNKRSNGTLKFPGITTITPDSGARIGGSGGDLYLGNANNSNWVKVQDICSHNGSNYWYIYQSGNAHFTNINVTGITNIGGNTTINGNTTIGGNCLAKGGVTAYQSSDIRLKQDLRKLDYLGIIKAMGGTFGFAWKKDNTRSIGWIAQHVLCNPHLKDIVETDEKGYYKINYWSPKLIATAFGAIEQVDDEVSRLKARVVFLESEVQRLSGDKEDCNKKRLDNKNINSLN